MGHRLNDLVITSAVAGIALLLLLLGIDNVVIRNVITLPLVLVVPGYAVIAAMFPQPTLGGAERLLFSLGLSIAIAVLGGFVLNWMPWGLERSSWTGLLSGITFGASIIALLRRRHQVVSVPSISTSIIALLRRRHQVVYIPSIRQNGFAAWQGFLLVLCVLIVGSALALARTPTSPQHLTGYSLLWMFPTDNHNAHTLQVGIKSMEFETTAYRLQVEVNHQVIKEWTPIVLKPNQSWGQTIVIQNENIASNPVEATLYRLDAPAQVYRQVVWRNEIS